MNEKLRRFRHQLGLVFDDDLGTSQWYNIVDWVIVFMIILSSVEIFAATFQWPEPVPAVLDWINAFTLWFFVVEVTLRIWAAPEQNPRYRGFMGRVRYCCTFYGFIDFISTYPFLIQFFVPLPISALKALRTARIIRVLRITRYAKSFNLLSQTIREKRNELIVSLQFLVVVTFILSLILFVYEHDAQPDVYDDGLRSVIWAFAQYIGDPGQFADTPPVTFPGKVIACLVGLLGIAIFAVPAGILGSGFTEIIEKSTRAHQLEENREKLKLAFERKLDRPTGYQAVPYFRTLADIQARHHMTCDDMIEAVDATPGFRLINLGSTIPTDRMPHDRLAIEHFSINRTYGQCIDRGSRVTVVSPSSMIDACTGIFSYYLALMGGFNYISREMGAVAPYKSYYAVKDGELAEGQAEYNADLSRLMSRPGAWSFTILAASGANEPEYDTQVHFGIGGAKGDESFAPAGAVVPSTDAFRNFYKTFEADAAQLGFSCDLGRYHSTAGANLWFRRVPMASDAGNVAVRIAWSAMLWSGKRMLLARHMADDINRSILGIDPPAPDKELTTKNIGFTV